MLRYAVRSLRAALSLSSAQIDILRKLDHPHIVSLKEVVVSKKDTYIVMELLASSTRHASYFSLS